MQKVATVLFSCSVIVDNVDQLTEEEIKQIAVNKCNRAITLQKMDTENISFIYIDTWI